MTVAASPARAEDHRDRPARPGRQVCFGLGDEAKPVLASPGRTAILTRWPMRALIARLFQRAGAIPLKDY